MKKTGIILLFLLLVASLCLFTACKKGDEDTTATENTTTTEVTTTTETAYQVTFAGKSVSEPVQSVQEGGFVQCPDDPVREGFTFEGWYIGEELFDFESVVLEDITLTAQWKTASYTVTFYDKDGETAKKSGSVQYNFKATAPILSLEDNEVLLGWYTEKAGEGTLFEADATVKADAVYYPHIVAGITLRFYDENKTTLLSTEKIPAGNKRAVPQAPDKSQSNKDFAGFFDSEENVYDADVVYTASASFYAKYTQYYQVKFMLGETEQKNARVASGATVTPPAVSNTDTEGKTFVGWFNEQDREWKETTAVTADTVYTALYKMQYTLTFVLPDSTPVMRNGTAYTLPVFENETCTLPPYTDALYADCYYLLPTADVLSDITESKTVTLTPVAKTDCVTKSLAVASDNAECETYMQSSGVKLYPQGYVMNSEGDYFTVKANIAGPVSLYIALTNHTAADSDDRFTVRIYVDGTQVNEYRLSYGQFIRHGETTVCTADLLEGDQTEHTVKVELYKIEGANRGVIEGVGTYVTDAGKEDGWGGIICTMAVFQEYVGE